MSEVSVEMSAERTDDATDTRRPDADQLRLAAVLLTIGDRAAELSRLVEAIRTQQGPPITVVLVCQGVPAPDGLPDGVRVVELPANVGIPEGRNVALRELGVFGDAPECDVVLTLDNDGLLTDPGLGAAVRAAFAAEPRLGVISFLLADPDTGEVQRRHVPRLRVGDPRRASRVTSFAGGANAIRSAVFQQVGELAGDFFMFHEETDLAWRALDAGWHIDYRPDLVLYHPATVPGRHPEYRRMIARNRVWLARRNLPWPLVPVYLGVWTAITVARTRSAADLKVWFSGFLEGWRRSCGHRAPMRWATVWRMVRLGRPPIV
jgi:GT2 family glycosyltransferase